MPKRELLAFIKLGRDARGYLYAKPISSTADPQIVADG